MLDNVDIAVFVPEMLVQLQDPKFLLVQGLGAIGFVVYILAMQWMSPRRTIMQQGFANLIFAAHFWILGQGFVTVLAVIASARDFCSAGLDNVRLQRFVLWVYLALLYGLAAFFARDLADICGLMGTTFLSASQFFRDRFYIFRGFCFMHQSLWGAVYFLTGSWFMFVMTFGLVGSNLWAVYRYARARARGV